MKRATDDEIDSLTFGVMLKDEEFRLLPDFYVKDIVKRVIKQLRTFEGQE